MIRNRGEMAAQREPTHIVRKYLDISFHPNAIDGDTAAKIFSMLETDISWPARAEKRRVAQVFSDEGSGVYDVYGKDTGKRAESASLPWDVCPALPILKKYAEALTGTNYNFCVAQRYPNGKIGIKAHRDKELAPDSVICGFSLGSGRWLVMTPPRFMPDEPPVRLWLPPGSLYMLNPPTNSYWAHSIEPIAGAGHQQSGGAPSTETRISLTFRNIPRKE